MDSAGAAILERVARMNSVQDVIEYLEELGPEEREFMDSIEELAAADPRIGRTGGLSAEDLQFALRRVFSRGVRVPGDGEQAGYLILERMEQPDNPVAKTFRARLRRADQPMLAESPHDEKDWLYTSAADLRAPARRALTYFFTFTTDLSVEENVTALLRFIQLEDRIAAR